MKAGADFMKKQELQHVFIIGCKGIPAHYGGFETFVDKLTEYQTDKRIQYHVACAADPSDDAVWNIHFKYHRACCTTFQWRRLGPARAIMYDLEALRYYINYAEQKKIPHPVFYILACRIGPFLAPFAGRIRQMDGSLYVNPDGHEFLRAKWSPPVRRYWKYSEKLMVRQADLLVCDSKNIAAYIRREYSQYHPQTAYIAYGAETEPVTSGDADRKLREWYDAHGLRAGEYYLVVGRFVPENNYETMIREYRKSGTKKAFVLITEVNDSFLEKLKKTTGFDKDPGIIFAGTVYDQDLLKKIREHAYGYFHGHEVGGTNPGLLEALGRTDLNLLLDVGFNREVAGDAACYWTKESGSLAALIGAADAMDSRQIRELGKQARERIRKYYSWEYITARYEELFVKSLAPG